MPFAFVDTSAWVALLAADDSHHEEAIQTFRTLPPRTHLITTNLVVAETVTWLVHHRRRPAVERYRTMLEASALQGALTTEWITERRHEEAWTYFERYQDQILSFCDCTSFVVAAERDVDFVFGFDRDFRIVGFDLRPGLP